MLNIEWTRAARQDLAEIVGFIANDNPLAARKMKVLIMEAVTPAARYPRIFRRGRVDGTHEIPLHPHYLLITRCWKLTSGCCGCYIRADNILSIFAAIDNGGFPLRNPAWRHVIGAFSTAAAR